MVEQLTRNEQAVGSIPTSGSTKDTGRVPAEGGAACFVVGGKWEFRLSEQIVPKDIKDLETFGFSAFIITAA